MKPKDPKPTKSKCDYCHGYGLDAGLWKIRSEVWPEGIRRPWMSKQEPSQTAPCDRCGKPNGKSA